MLPICRLQILEVFDGLEVELLEIFLEDDDRVADEEMSEVGGEWLIHATLKEPLLELGMHYEIWVEVFLAEARVLGDVGRVGGIPGFGYAPAVVLERLSGFVRGRVPKVRNMHSRFRRVLQRSDSLRHG